VLPVEQLDDRELVALPALELDPQQPVLELKRFQAVDGGDVEAVDHAAAGDAGLEDPLARGTVMVELATGIRMTASRMTASSSIGTSCFVCLRSRLGFATDANQLVGIRLVPVPAQVLLDPLCPLLRHGRQGLLEPFAQPLLEPQLSLAPPPAKLGPIIGCAGFVAHRRLPQYWKRPLSGRSG
jgi:hypothetical protein